MTTPTAKTQLTVDEQIQAEMHRQLGITTVHIDIARIVRDTIDELGLLDWSKCTRAAFREAVREAMREGSTR